MREVPRPMKTNLGKYSDRIKIQTVQRAADLTEFTWILAFLGQNDLPKQAVGFLG